MEPAATAKHLRALLARSEDGGALEPSALELEALSSAVSRLELEEPPVLAPFRGVGPESTLGVDLTGVLPQLGLGRGASMERVELGGGIGPSLRWALEDFDASPETEVQVCLQRMEDALPPGLDEARRAFVLPEVGTARREGRVRAAIRALYPDAFCLPRSLAVAAGVVSELSERTTCLVVHADAFGSCIAPVLLRPHASGDRWVAHRTEDTSSPEDPLERRLAHWAGVSIREMPTVLVPSGWARLGDFEDSFRVVSPPGATELGPRMSARMAAAIGVTRARSVEDRGWVRA